MSRRATALLSVAGMAGMTVLGLAGPAHAGNTSAASPMATLTQLPLDVVPGLSQLTALGPTAPSTPVTIEVSLPDSNQAGETAFLHAVTTPGNPLYHHFLTPPEFAARFGANQYDYQQALGYSIAHGLQVENISESHDLISLTGTVAQAEATFAVAIDNYTWHGLNFYANANPPSVPAGLGIIGVVGLNTAQRMHTFHQAPAASAPHGPTPSQSLCDPSGSLGCAGVTTPEDMRSTYDMPAGNDGQGQTVAVFGEGNYTGPISDLRLFESHFGLPAVPVKVVLAQGDDTTKYSDTSGDVEWDLDTQAETGMAPDVQQLVLYFSDDANFDDADTLLLFQDWADDPNGPLQANASFGECEYDPAAASLPAGGGFAAGQAYTVSAEQAFAQANAEGRTLFASAGDTGSSCPVAVLPAVGAGNGILNQANPDVNYPCASPHVVCVGGTVLYTNGGDTSTAPTATNKATRALEYSWTFTGGGSSFQFPEPSFQASTAGVQGQVPGCLYDDQGNPVTGDVPCRAVPDVAAMSGDISGGEGGDSYSIYISGSLSSEGGTSLSSPLNVGMWTLSQAAASGTGGNGFADPVFYQHQSDFYDIGNPQSNPPSPPATNGYFDSAPGWDYLSGLGVPDVTTLMTAVDGKTTPTNDEPSPNKPTWEAVDPSTGAVVQQSATSSGTGVAAGATIPGPNVTYYLHQNGCGATNPASYYLNEAKTVSGGDTGDGCGTIGGLPLDEVEYQAGVPLSNTFSTLTGDSTLPLTVNGNQTITGAIATESWTGTIGGAGTVTADVTVSGVDTAGNIVNLGTTTSSVSALPTQTAYSIPFTLPARPSANAEQLTTISITVTLHGLNWNAEAASYDGTSYVTVGSLVAAPATPSTA